MKIEKQCVPVFIGENNEPKAIIFYNINRERIIYKVTKADEEELIELYESKNKEKIELGEDNLPLLVNKRSGV